MDRAISRLWIVPYPGNPSGRSGEWPGESEPARPPPGGRWITVLVMTDDASRPGEPAAPGDPAPGAPAPDAPAPTVIVGYPSAAPTAGDAGSGVASLRGQVRTLRYLVVACLGLLVVLMIGLGVALAGSRTQLDALSQQVTALGAQVDTATAQQAAPQAAQPAPAPESTEVPQLGPAPDLQGLAELPAGADASGAILVGDPAATDVVEVYIDYQCPYCQRWEQSIGKELIDKAVQPGSGLLVKQYNLAFLGETGPELDPAGASARAASAAACVVNHDGAETFVAFSRGVFAAADPSEPPGQFTAPVLVDLAQQAGASADAIACIEAEQNVPFVSATTKAGFGRGVGGTPTVVVNGQTVGNPFTDPTLLAMVGGAASG